jgi:hypothetical protein
VCASIQRVPFIGPRKSFEGSALCFSRLSGAPICLLDVPERTRLLWLDSDELRTLLRKGSHRVSAHLGVGAASAPES